MNKRSELKSSASIILRVWVALAPLALGACEKDQSFARMGVQARYEAYAPSLFFPDGAAMRPPPAGTVAVGTVVADPRVASGMEGGKWVEEVPLPLTRELLERGRGRFEIFCAACHGVLANGATVVAAHMELRKAPALVEHFRKHPPGEVYAVIASGYGLMPSYASELSVEERWAVAAYARALALSQGVRLDELPPEVRAEAEEALR